MPLTTVAAVIVTAVVLMNTYAGDQKAQDEVIKRLQIQQESHQAVFEEKMANVSKVLDRIAKNQEDNQKKHVVIGTRLTKLEVKIDEL
tara:strand:+ start:111 stop:374 length:264 start_codon:yes stop_codon:yes gene_type:complete